MTSYYEKHKDEPDFKAKNLAKVIRWQAKQRADPVLLETMQEKRRMWDRNHYQERKSDPVFMDMERRRSRERYAHKKNDVEWMDRQRKNALARYYRYREDPNAVRRININRKNSYERAWEEVFNVYGRVCACCGESDPGFLTVDHINNDGAEERRKLNNGKYRFGGTTGSSLRRIAKEADLSRYQILCWNCNCGRAHNNGICPHKEQGA